MLPNFTNNQLNMTHRVNHKVGYRPKSKEGFLLILKSTMILLSAIIEKKQWLYHLPTINHILPINHILSENFSKRKKFNLHYGFHFLLSFLLISKEVSSSLSFWAKIS